MATVTAASGLIKIRIRERTDGRGSRYLAEYHHPVHGRCRRSLHTDDLKEAESRACDLAKQLASESSDSGTSLLRSRLSDITLGELFDQYRAQKLPTLMKQGCPTGHYRNMERVIRVAESLWGRDLIVLEIGQTHKDQFEARRKAGGFLVPPPVLPQRSHQQVRKPPTTTLGPCNARTVRGELQLLSAIFHWGMHTRTPSGQGIPLLPFNPIACVNLFCGEERPRRRPPMLRAAYAILLQLASRTGRRPEDIMSLRVQDLLLPMDEGLSGGQTDHDS